MIKTTANRWLYAIAADESQLQLFGDLSLDVSAGRTQMSSKNRLQLLYIYQRQFKALRNTECIYSTKSQHRQ